MNTPEQWAKRVYHPASSDKSSPGKQTRSKDECYELNTVLFDAAMLAARIDEREKFKEKIK